MTRYMIAIAEVEIDENGNNKPKNMQVYSSFDLNIRQQHTDPFSALGFDDRDAFGYHRVFDEKPKFSLSAELTLEQYHVWIDFVNAQAEKQKELGKVNFELAELEAQQ